MEEKMMNITKKLSAILAAAVMTVTLAISASAAVVDTDMSEQPITESPASTISASLPLAAYPDGSYYSLTGKACTCHTMTYNPCYWDNSCDCINFDLSIQCAAFAKYIYYVVNGKHTSNSTTINKNMSLTAATAKSTLQSLPVGTYLRVRTSGGSQHSIAIAGTSSTGITIYHANYGSPCKVRYQTLDWATFASSYNYLYHYVA